MLVPAQIEPLRRGVLPKWGDRTYVMGVVNVTPDSFSGDGLGAGDERAVEQAVAFVAAGADILDVGGESTKPSADPVSGEQERSRVIPVIQAIRAALPDVVISIDSYRADTAAAALDAGADWLNDIWGIKLGSPQGNAMASLAAARGVPIVLMHNGRDRERQQREGADGRYYGYYHYDNLLAEVMVELKESAERALVAGVSAENIILDPGIGFGKNGSQNLEMIYRLDQLKTLGFPILLGTSRKGFIGHVLGGLPASDRVEGTAATVAIGIDRGADIVRVHDVKEMVRIARMTDAIVRMKAEG